MAKPNIMETRYLSEEDRRALLARLRRAQGQVAALSRMVERAECVDQLLVQIAAVKAALTQTALLLVERHLVDCVETCMEGERPEVVRRVMRAMAAVLRNG